MQLKGVVKRSDIEGGLWLLHSDDGQVYQLRGGGADLLKDGLRATIECTVDGGAFGIGMVGAVVDVESYSIDS